MTSSQPAIDDLIRALQAHGIHYLAAADEDAIGAGDISSADLLIDLARAPDVRLRDAIITLLLLDPSLADVLDTVLSQVDETSADHLTVMLLATLYLQREWYWLLTLARRQPPAVPEPRFARYWQSRHLPAPSVDFGRAGLCALAEDERRRTHTLADFAGDWQNQIAHLIQQEWQRHQSEPIVIPAAWMPPWHVAEETAMIMRPDVARTDIEQFLHDLGRMVRHPGRIYLAGGTALVHCLVRGANARTADIDLKLDVTDLNEVENAVRQLKVRLAVNVEIASPADFIPLPTTWEAHSRYVGRYGPLDVFYFDFTTLALAKIERGQARDLQDIALLKQQGLIERAELEGAFQEILPQIGHGRFFNIDPTLFAQKFAAAVQSLWSQP